MFQDLVNMIKHGRNRYFLSHFFSDNIFLQIELFCIPTDPPTTTPPDRA
ncbi:hypothetical protein CAEBREN_31607, partial [Caenorhabditis brenneri]